MELELEQNQEKTPKKRRLIRVAVSVIVVLLVALVIYMVSQQQKAFTPIKYEKSLVELQAEQDKKLEIGEASLENPKVVLNPYGISPLTAVVIFKTDEPVTPEITVVGKDDLTTFNHKFEESTEHRLPIYGLYLGQENKVELKVGEIVKELIIKTDPAPESFPEVVEVTAKKDFLNNELYFMTGSSANARTIAYDVNGDVRWYLNKDMGWEIKRLQNGRLILSTERLVKGPYYSTGLYEVDLLGKIYTEYTLPGGYHHDVFERSNGNLIVASDGTDNGRKTIEDVVVEIDRETGEIIKQIDLSKVWPTDTGKSIAWTATDWFHNNSVWLDEERNELVVSGRHQDAVAVLDYETDKLKFIIGSSESWSEEMQQYFLRPLGDNFEWQWEQHAAKVLPNGDYLLFDNGNNKTKNADAQVPGPESYSRAVIYRVNREAKTIEQIWQYGKERGNRYYSPYISEAEYLGENHFLVHSGGANFKDGVATNLPAAIAQANELRSYTTEILGGQAIFEVVTNSNNYRAEKMPAYTKFDVSVKLGRAKQLGNLIESYTCSDIPVDKAVAIDDDYNSHDIELKQEYDRLVLSGTFDKKQIVRVALKQGGKQRTYDITVDEQHDSTALCVDIFNYEYQSAGDSTNVIDYINATGLEGEYQIYLSINDRVYNTTHSIKF